MPFCVFCEQELTDGRKESGFNGLGPDWMVDGDFGCDMSPGSGEDGVCGHHTREELGAILLNADETVWRMNLYSEVQS